MRPEKPYWNIQLGFGHRLIACPGFDRRRSRVRAAEALALALDGRRTKPDNHLGGVRHPIRSFQNLTQQDNILKFGKGGEDILD
jgi:hypothetical protein